jgi:naphthalene 1,2-dioxygenase ferredoxin reductase component
MAKLTINGKVIEAGDGLTLTEAAMQKGILIPQDCCSGQCETCRVDVLEGAVDPVGTQYGVSVLACQAKVAGDAAIHFDAVPVPFTTSGRVVSLKDLSGEIVEVIIEVEKQIPYLPGQYINATFAGFPGRDYSPALTMDGLRELNQIVLHIKKLQDGVVSSALGKKIVPGSKVKIKGPHGSAFLRRGEGRLVLVSSGTGFAPIWSIAVAARLGQPERELVLVAGARDPRNLYMRPAFDWLAKHGVRALSLTASGAQPLPPAHFGRPTSRLPDLQPGDTVYAAGSPEMVEAVKEIAQKAGVRCYADPFTAAATPTPLSQRIARFFGRSKAKPEAVAAE